MVPEPVVIGVDGCRAGWLAVIWGQRVTHQLCATFAEVLALDGAIVAVDMPIGLPARSGRNVESLVRKVLRGRAASVFTVACRDAVQCTEYRHACATNAGLTDPPRKISQQSFSLFPKIREVDALITPDLQNRVYEAHPEAAFWAMNGEAPVALAKTTTAGQQLRLALLTKAGFPFASLPPLGYLRREAGLDDLIDACACAVVARRILTGAARRFPPDPARDVRGLRMEINA